MSLFGANNEINLQLGNKLKIQICVFLQTQRFEQGQLNPILSVKTDISKVHILES